MGLPPNIRIQVPTPFPSLVTGSGPITVSKMNGIWQIGYSVAGINVQPIPPAGNQPTDYVLVWDSVAKTFFQVPLSTLTATGGATLLNTIVANNSAALQDSSFTLGFNEYEFVFENIIPSVNTGVSLEAQVKVGATFRTTGYLNSAGGLTSGVDLLQAASLGTGGFSGSVRMFTNPASTQFKMFRGVGTYGTTGGAVGAATAAGYLNNAALVLDGIQFLVSGANTITSGTIKVYGTL